MLHPLKALRHARPALLATTLLAASLMLAQAATVLRADHPVIGTWRLDLPDGRCHEIYRIRRDGTTLVTSAAEVAETEFEVSDQPDAQGFFNWSDQIVRDNGQPDCSGEVTPVGQRVIQRLIFNPAGDMFLMCLPDHPQRCIGPFVRQEDDQA